MMPKFGIVAKALVGNNISLPLRLLIFFIFQSNVIRLRAKQGIHPHLPPPEEREVIKQKHAQHLKELQFGKTNE